MGVPDSCIQAVFLLYYRMKQKDYFQGTADSDQADDRQLPEESAFPRIDGGRIHD